MVGVTDDELLDLLDAELGPVLEPAGFSTAQGGWQGAVFWCGQADFVERFPWLPQASPEEWQRAVTTDLTIDFDQTTGLLNFIHLEERTLYATLHTVGRADLAGELRAALAAPLTESLPVAARALAAVFNQPES